MLQQIQIDKETLWTVNFLDINSQERAKKIPENFIICSYVKLPLFKNALLPKCIFN